MERERESKASQLRGGGTHNKFKLTLSLILTSVFVVAVIVLSELFIVGDKSNEALTISSPSSSSTSSTTSLKPSGSSEFRSVSCASTICIAVGSYED